MFLFASQGPKTQRVGVTMICERGCLKHVHVVFCEMWCSWCSKSKHHLWSVVSPVIQRFVASPWFSAFHPRNLMFSCAMGIYGAIRCVFSAAVIMCECKHRAGNPPGGFQCIQAVMRLCCGPTTSRKHVDPDSSGKKNISFDYLLPFFVVRKKMLKKSGHVIMRKIRNHVSVCIQFKKKELYFQKSIWHHIGSSRLLNMRASVFVEFPQLLFWLGFVHQSWVLGNWFGGEVKGFQTSLPSQHYQLPLHRFFVNLSFCLQNETTKLRWMQLQTSKCAVRNSFFFEHPGFWIFFCWGFFLAGRGGKQRTCSFNGAKTGVSWHHPKIPSKSCQLRYGRWMWKRSSN